MSLSCQLAGAQLCLLGGRLKAEHAGVFTNVAQLPCGSSHCSCRDGRVPVTSWPFSFPSFSMSHVSKSGVGTGAARLRWWGPWSQREGRQGGDQERKEGREEMQGGKGSGDREGFGLERVKQYPLGSSCLCFSSPVGVPDHLPCLRSTSHLYEHSV